MKKPLLISIAPNVEKDDVKLAFKMIWKPLEWYNFRHTEKLEFEFAKRFGKEYKALSVNSGRSAMFLILKAMGISSGDEVCLQAFTCSAAVNPVIWNGAKPVYIDIDGSYNLDPVKLQKKITKNTKAVIVQHTFGIPSDVEKILKIVKNKKILLIEDCAVSLGANYSGKEVGRFGDAAFFSFGRDKIISGTFGGMILTKNKKLFGELEKLRDTLLYPTPLWTLQQLLNPVFSPLIKSTYFLGIGKMTVGKVLLWMFQKIGVLGKAISYEEKLASLPQNLYPRKIPGVIAVIILNQLRKLDRFNNQRKKLADFYYKSFSEYKNCLPPKNKGSVWLRFPFSVGNKSTLIENLKKDYVLLGDWYKSVVYPVLALHYFNYSQNSCPKAETAVNSVINLPTNPTMSLDDAQRIVDGVKKWIKN